jgi:N-acetylmuramoyl-L-alanine amidase
MIETIVLDAGHGKDPGNSYHGYTEKASRLKRFLKLVFLKKADNFKNYLY